MEDHEKNIDMEAVSITNYPGLGKGLAASRDIDEGEVIIYIPEPCLLVVEKAVLETACSYCIEVPLNGKLQRCNACHGPRYCSVDCQKRDWKVFHKLECSNLKSLGRLPPTPARAIMQVLSRYQNGDDLSKILNLNGHDGHFLDCPRVGDLALQAQGAVKFAQVPSSLFNIAMRVLCVMAANAFQLTTFDDERTGVYLSPTLALANHSCFPNAHVSFSGRSAFLRSIRPIKQSEQIFISYVDTIDPIQLRKRRTTRQYFFTCHCQVCDENMNPYEQYFLARKDMNQEKHAKLLDTLWNESLITAEANACQDADRSAKIHCSYESLSARGDWKKKHDDARNEVFQVREEHVPKTHRRFVIDFIGLFNDYNTLNFYAQAPYPTFLNDLCSDYVKMNFLVEALIVRLFMSRYCDPYTYPWKHHPARVQHLYATVRIMKEIVESHISVIPDEDPKFSAAQKDIIRNIDLMSAAQALLYVIKELVEISHGKKSRFYQVIEVNIAQLEIVQQRRGGPVHQHIKDWSLHGQRVQGYYLVARLFAGLRDLAGMIGVVAPGIKINEKFFG